MNIIETNCITKLMIPDKISLETGCYSCGYYYFLAFDCKKILVFDLNFKYYTSFPTKRIYKSITYDILENIFFATSSSSNEIYKLNSYMDEIEVIKLSEYVIGTQNIICITYNEIKNILILASDNYFFEISKDGICNKKIKRDYSKFIDIYSLNNYLFELDNNSIRNINIHKECLCIKKCQLTAKFKFKGIICGCYDETNNVLKIYLLVENFVCETLIICLIIEICNWEKDFDCKTCNDRATNCNAIDDILESIALMEASLAHILNAEGEKLQKAISISNNIDELLCINKSVEKTIVKITALETQLFSKLVATQDLYNDLQCGHKCINKCICSNEIS